MTIEEELERFLGALASTDAPILRRRQPGLTPRQLEDALTELRWPADVGIPREAYAWWSWQNGTIPRTPSDDYATSTVPVISPEGLILRSIEAEIANWTSSWMSAEARPPAPYVPLGADASEAGIFGLRPGSDGQWRISRYITDAGEWRLTHTQPGTPGPAPTLAEYLHALTDGIHAGRIGTVLTGGIYILDDTEEGLVGLYPWRSPGAK